MRMSLGVTMLQKEQLWPFACFLFAGHAWARLFVRWPWVGHSAPCTPGSSNPSHPGNSDTCWVPIFFDCKTDEDQLVDADDALIWSREHGLSVRVGFRHQWWHFLRKAHFYLRWNILPMVDWKANKLIIHFPYESYVSFFILKVWIQI